MTVNPQISGLTTQDSQLTLQRLSDAVWLREGATGPVVTEPVGTEPVGTTAPTEAIISRPADQTDFDELDKAFKGLGPLVKRLRATAARYEFQTDEVRDSAIERALQPFRAGHNASGKFPGGITADLDDSLITDIALKGQGFRAGEEIELVLTQTEQAELAALFLELGAGGSDGISLGGDGGSFTLEIAGAGGTQSLSFSSGQTLGQIAAAISSFAEATGVQATVSGTGVVLSSTAFGSGAFTTVRIADDGGITDNGSGSTLGIYTLGEDGTAAGSGSNFSSAGAANGVTDEGQDAVVEINGVQAERVGDYWAVNLGNVEVAINLDEEAIAAAGDGPVTLGTVGKPKKGHDGQQEIRGEPGHRGRHRGQTMRENGERETRTESAEHGGGLLPGPEDEGGTTKVAEPQLRVDIRV